MPGRGGAGERTGGSSPGRRRAARIRVGTSGWSYPHWRGPFYPGELPADSWLPFYARRFATVEINNTFYRLPEPSTFRKWRDAVPPGFLFSVKASGFITHRKKLKDPGATLPPFLERIRLLGERLGPVLFQLPPRWRCDPGRLETFLSALPRSLRCAFEFRDPSWCVPEVYGLLSRRGAAFCIFDLGGSLSPTEVTAEFAYVRLHGPGGPYAGCYGRRALEGWAETLAGWADRGLDAYCYFDNDQAGHAARNAAELRRMLGEP